MTEIDNKKVGDESKKEEKELTESVNLISENFITETGHGTWLVKHYAPWCPHCQKLAPFWAKLSVKYKEEQKLKGFHFGEVNCDAEPTLCDNHGVTSYPTIILYHRGEKVDTFKGFTNTDYYLDLYLKNVTTFDWDKTGKLPEFKLDKLSSEEKHRLSVPLFEKSFEFKEKWDFSFINFCDSTKLDCSNFIPQWLELAHNLNMEPKTKSVTLAQVDCNSEINLCNEQEIIYQPTLKLFHNAELVASYPTSDSKDIDTLKKFIIEKVAEHPEPSPKKTPATEKPKEELKKELTVEPPPKPDTPEVKPLDKTAPDDTDTSNPASFINRSSYIGSGNFTEITKDGIWFIQFRSPTPGSRPFDLKWAHLSNDFSMFLKRYGVQFGTIECGSDEEFCHKNGATSFPDVQIYEFGAHIDTYNGTSSYEDLKSYIRENTHQLHSASNLPTHTFPSALIPNIEGKTIDLVDTNFDKLTSQGPWFVFFKTTTCKLCRTVVPDWEDLAKRFKKQVNFSIVNCQKETALCRRLGVRTYPSFTFYKDGAAREYRGPHTLESFDHYSKAASAPHLHILDSDSLKSLSQKESSYYIYTYDQHHSTDHLASLEPILKGMYLNLDLYLLPSDKAERSKVPKQLPALQVFHDDKLVSQYPGPFDDIDRAQGWLNQTQFGPTTTLDIANFDLFMGYFDSAVVAVVEPLKDAVTLDQYRTSARQYKKSPTAKVGFAVLDGIQWKEYVERVYQRTERELPFVAVTHPKLNTFDTKLPSGDAIPFSGTGLLDHVDGFVKKYESVKVDHEPSGFSFPTFLLFFLFAGILFGLYRTYRRH